MISDTFFTPIGDRKERPYERLFIEDSFGRLSRNGFVAGTKFDATPRAGVGLIFTPSAQGRYTVTPRRGGSLLSFEQRGLSDIVRSKDVRVRVCVKSISVMPCLRLFHVGRPNNEVWTIAGSNITTPAGERSIVTAAPVSFRDTPLRIEADLTTANVVFATEIIGNAKPAEVKLTGEHLMQVVGGQFLSAIGYQSTEAGIWHR